MNWARVGATLAAFAGLAALWLLAFGWDAGPSGVLLLTPGSSESFAVAQIKRDVPREVLMLEGPPPISGAARVASVRAAVSRLQPGERLIVAGWGLGADEWAETANIETVFEPVPAPEGFVSLDAPARLAVGQSGRIQGLVRAGAGAAMLRLIGPGGRADSLAVTDSTTAFTFGVQAPAEGRFVWRLELRRGAKVVAADSFGIAIETATPLRVLVLEHSPSFELNALAGWLGAGGAMVERQTRVSRGRAQVTAFNRPVRPLALLDTAVTRTVDVVVLHDATFERLPRGERLALERAVRNRGLGMVLLTEGKLGESASRLSGASARSFGDGAVRRTRPTLPGLGMLEDVEAGSSALNGGTALARDAQGRTVAALYSAGVGTVAISTLVGTDAWRRRGADSTFGRWWSTLLESVRGTDPSRDDWQWETPVRTDHRAILLLRTVDPEPLRLHTEPDGTGDTLAFAHDPVERVRWRAAFWPRRAGWHTVGGPRGGRTYFVAERDSWRALEAASRLAASRGVSGTQPLGSISRAPDGFRNALRVLLFVTLVAAVGYLWWEERHRKA